MADTEGFARDVRAAMRWVMELADRAERQPEIGEVYAAEESDPTIYEMLDQASSILLWVDILCSDQGWIENPEPDHKVSP